MNRETLLNLIADYDNVIFDYGGVFLDIYYQKAIQNMSLVANKDISSHFTQKSQGDLFNLFETGIIAEKDFFNGICELFSLDKDQMEPLKRAWNSMLGEMPEHRVETLREIRQNKNVFLLSNINETHENYLRESIQNTSNSDFFELFDAVYFSHHVKMRKPNQEIFEYVINQNQLSKSETLFIDDSEQHIIGARKMGIDAYLLPSNSL